MRYRIILYDRATDEAMRVIDVPSKHLCPVLAIAGVADPDALGELPLGEEQIVEIAKLIGFAAEVSRFHYHLEPFAPAHASVSGT